MHKRTSLDGEENIFCVFNLTAEEQFLEQLCPDEAFVNASVYYDVLRAREVSAGKKGFSVKPYQAMWLVARP